MSKNVVHWGEDYNISLSSDKRKLTIKFDDKSLDREQVKTLISDLPTALKKALKEMADETTFEKDKNGKVVIKKVGKTIAMQG